MGEADPNHQERSVQDQDRTAGPKVHTQRVDTGPNDATGPGLGTEIGPGDEGRDHDPERGTDRGGETGKAIIGAERMKTGRGRRDSLPSKTGKLVCAV